MAPTPSDILAEIASALSSHDPDGDSDDLVEELHCIMEQYDPEPMSTPTPEQINKLVTFTKKSDGEWAVRDVHGPVRGNVYSHIEGSVYADIRGHIHGGVEGTVSGPVRGSVCGGVGGTISGHKFSFIYTDEDHRLIALAEESDANQSARVVSATQEHWRARLSRQGELLVYAEPIAVRSITMSKPLRQVNLKMPTLEEDQLITAAAESDADALPLTDEPARFAAWLREHSSDCMELGRPDWAHMSSRAAELLDQP